MLGASLSVPVSHPKKKKILPKGNYNTMLEVPQSAMKQKQERLLNKLNRMMGGGQISEG